MSLSPSAKNSAYVFSGTLISRILGFFRVVLIGTTLGYTRLGDSYNLANEIPNMMYELILGSLIASTMIPFFVQQYKKKDKQADHALMSFVVISSALITVIALILSPFIARAMTSLNASSSANAQSQLVHFFLLFFLPQIFFYSITAAMQAYLAARSKFIAAAYVPIINNIVVIGVLLYLRGHATQFTDSLEELRTSKLILILALGTTIGVALVTFLLMISYRRAGGRFSFSSLTNNSVRKLITRSKWMVAYAITNQIALFIIIAFANSLAGGVAMYLVAWSFFQLPHGLIANSIMTTIIPKITHSIKFGDDADDMQMTEQTATLTRHSSTGLTVAMAVTTALLISVATPALNILIAHGNISVEQSEHTARVLIGFVAFLPAFSLYLFCVRLANSLNSTKIIFVIGVVQNSLNIVLAILLKPTFGIVGLSVAFSFSYAIVVLWSLRTLSTRLRTSLLDYKTTIFSILICIISAILGYSVSIYFNNPFIGVVTGLLTCLIVLATGSLIVKEALKDLLRLVYVNKASE